MAKLPNVFRNFRNSAQSLVVSLTVRELLYTFGDRLVLHTPSEAAELDRPINWVAPTELLDPTPFVVGRELVLTTGVSLPANDPSRSDAFIERLSSVNAAALGFGSGLSHESVPDPLLAAARKHGLPLIEVPYDTAFIELSRVIAESVIAERYEVLQHGLATHETLASVLLSGGDLDAMVARLHRLIGGPAAVIDVHGRLLASSPNSADWPIGHSADPAHPSSEVHTAPIAINEELIAHLFLRITHDDFVVHAIPYATTLIALEMSRRQAELEGRRELVGQVIEDILKQRISDHDAHSRLGAFGIDLNQSLTVLIASPSRPGAALRRAWSGHDLATIPTPFVTALIEDELVVVTSGELDQHSAAVDVFDRFVPLDNGLRVGIGGSHRATAGLRMSYLEAREAVTIHGPGVHRSRSLNLTTMLLVNRELPVRDMALDLLQPLLSHDSQRNSELVHTLTTYLENSGSVTETASILTLHRNSLRYRLEQIADLTGIDLSSFSERVRLWIALQALELDGNRANS